MKIVTWFGSVVECKSYDLITMGRCLLGHIRHMFGGRHRACAQCAHTAVQLAETQRQLEQVTANSNRGNARPS